MEPVNNCIKEHKDDVFEAIVLLAGTNDIKSKSASTTTNSIAQELLKTAQDLLSKDNVKRVFICKIPPSLDNQMRDVKVTEINEKVVESMHDMNIENLFLIESVSKEIQNFNKDGLHLSIVHSLSSGKVEMFLCAVCHAFTPHVNAWKR